MNEEEQMSNLKFLYTHDMEKLCLKKPRLSNMAVQSIYN